MGLVAAGPIWGLPFAGLLLSIAILPMVAGPFWHHHHGKVAMAWTAALLVPSALLLGLDMTIEQALHALAHEYIPFIALLLALYVIGGGIRLTRTLSGTPLSNTALLAVGTLLASLIGTTGAAMLLIRPLLRANEWRHSKVHAVVFFIFLVGNIGGSLTPIGDPPLFLGYLRGVSFFWTVQHMAGPMAIASLLLLAAFFVIDRHLLRRDGARPPPRMAGEGPLVEGWGNVVLLLGVVAAVVISGSVKSGVELTLGPVHVSAEEAGRIVVLFALTGISLWTTSPGIRSLNEFNWMPIREVAVLFLGLFLTISPVLAMLAAGQAGPFAPLLNLLQGASGQPDNVAYFWITGLLSSVLDNAPTYLVFFEAAGGDPVILQGSLEQTLLAISAGSVFMGALTYIGNAPNFMVRSIAESRGVPMPSFFGFIAWSAVLLVPVFVLISLLWF